MIGPIYQGFLRNKGSTWSVVSLFLDKNKMVPSLESGDWTVLRHVGSGGWGAWKDTPLFRRRSIICASNFQITEFPNTISQPLSHSLTADRRLKCLNTVLAQASVYLVNWSLLRSLITKYFIQILEKIPQPFVLNGLFIHSNSPKFIVLSSK